MILTDTAMEELIHRYFDACNRASAAAIEACFVPAAVHHFPLGTYGGPFRGAREIAERWIGAVARLGSVWTVDQVLIDSRGARAVVEWTHFKTFQGVTLRGDEWYVFDRDSGLIQEIRAYYAAPQPADGDRFELGGFDYAGRGYSIAAPIRR